MKHPQAVMHYGDGTTVYRWFVYVGDRRFPVWTATADEARARTEKRQRQPVTKVEPAPHPMASERRKR